MSLSDKKRSERESTIETEDVAIALLEVAVEKKGVNPVILDMRELVTFTDFFLIVTARNPKAAQAIAEAIRLAAKHKYSLPITGVEGVKSSKWILVDVPGIVIHVFDASARGFYDLEGLWSDAPRLDLPELAIATDDEPAFFFPN